MLGEFSLNFTEFRVATLFFQKLFMGSFFADFAILEDEQFIGISQSGKPVGNYKSSSALY